MKNEPRRKTQLGPSGHSSDQHSIAHGIQNLSRLQISGHAILNLFRRNTVLSSHRQVVDRSPSRHNCLMNPVLQKKYRVSAARLTATIVTATASIASAHPGHGSPTLQETPLHWLEPSHFGLVIVIAASVFLASKLLRRDQHRPNKNR